MSLSKNINPSLVLLVHPRKTRPFTSERLLMECKESNQTLGRVAQSVTCLATEACLTAIPGVASSIPARWNTFMEIDHEIISTVILLPSTDSFKKGCCQLQAKVCARITGYLLVQACPGKSVVRRTDCSAMTIAVYLGRKATKKTNKQKQNKSNKSVNNYSKTCVKQPLSKRHKIDFQDQLSLNAVQKYCILQTFDLH